MYPPGFEACLTRAVRCGQTNKVRQLFDDSRLRQTWWDGYSLLCFALKNYKLQMARILLYYGCRVNDVGNGSDSPLHLSTFAEDLGLIKLLLHKGAFVEARNQDGCTPLHFSALLGDTAAVDLLMMHGASGDVLDNEGFTPFHVAVMQKAIGSVHRFLQHGVSIDKRATENSTALHLAVQTGDFELVELLIANGASVNVANDKNETPFYQGLKQGNENILMLLLEVGAEVYHQGLAREPVIHLAVKSGIYDIVKLFFEQDNSSTNLKDCPQLCGSDLKDNPADVRQIMDYKTRINSLNQDGKSPLILAIERVNYEIVQLLLDNGASPNLKTREGISATYIAAAKGCENILTLLLMQGADIEINLKRNNKTILNHSVERSCLMIVDHILTHCDVAKEDYFDLLETAVQVTDNCRVWKDGGYKMDLVKLKTSCRIVERLIEHGFSVTAQCVENGLAVEAAIKNGFVAVFEDLLKLGLDVNMSADYNACQLVHLAANYGQKKILEMLVDNGASVDVQDRWEKSPLFYAVQNGDSKITDWLLKHVDVDRQHKAFNLAVCLSDVDIVKMFLRFNYNVNNADENGETALHHVSRGFYKDWVPKITGAECNRAEVASLLIQKGSETDVRSDKHETPFMLAVKNSNLEIITILLSSNVDVNCKFESSYTCFPLRCFQLCQALCTGDPGVKKIAHTMHQAETNCSRECQKLLLDWGASTDARTDEGMTPLIMAVKTQDLEMVEMLLEYDANTSYKDQDGMTALDRVCQQAHEDDHSDRSRSALLGIFKLLLNTNDINTSNHSLLLGLEKSRTDLILVSEMSVIFQHQIFMLRTANLFLKNEYINLELPYVTLDFQEKCQIEIATMMSEEVTEGISFYDILRMPSARLVACNFLDDFPTFITCDAWKEKYPIYRGLIQIKLEAASRRRQLLEKFRSVFGLVFERMFSSYFNLPDLCVEEVMSFFTNQDLRRLLASLGEILLKD